MCQAAGTFVLQCLKVETENQRKETVQQLRRGGPAGKHVSALYTGRAILGSGADLSRRPKHLELIREETLDYGG